MKVTKLPIILQVKWITKNFFIKEMIKRYKGMREKAFKPFKVRAVYVDMEILYGWCSDNGYTISEFCKQVGILRQSFYQYANGKSPSLTTRKKILRITGLKSKKILEN